MKKTTLKGTKRKTVALSVCFLASVSLIGTGFAAWVISTQQNGTTNGNIAIGEVKDSSVTFYNAKLTGTDIKFQPLQSDTTGRVRWDGDEDNSEVLSTVLTVYFDNSSYVDSIHLKLDVPAGISTAASSNYIVLPDCASAGGVDIGITDSSITDSSVDGGGNAITDGKLLTYTVSFSWGSFFKNENPGLYYDDSSSGGGLSVSDDDMKSQLEAFRDCLTTKTAMTLNISAAIN